MHAVTIKGRGQNIHVVESCTG